MDWISEVFDSLASVNWQVGSISATAGAIGTTLAFVLGYRVFRRDAEVRRLKQTRKIVFYRQRTIILSSIDGQDPTGGWRYTIIENLSDEPIFDLEISEVVDGRRGRKIMSYAVLTPDDGAIKVTDEADADLVYRDNALNIWQRSHDGRVAPFKKPSWIRKKDPRMKAMKHGYGNQFSPYRSKTENQRRERSDPVVQNRRRPLDN